MAAIEKAALKITPVVSGAALWQIEVSWILVVPYWEVGSWCRETIELVEGELGQGGAELVRWRSDPWQIVAEGDPPDGAHFRIRRQVPAELAGPSVLDVDPDGVVVDVVALPGDQPAVLVRLTEHRRLDRLHARIGVEPVRPTGDTAVTAVVSGQFGDPR